MKTKKTKMSLAELAAMRGVEKTVQAGCTFDAAHMQQENPIAGMTNKQRREYESVQKQRAHQEQRAKELAEKYGLELEIRGGIDCDYYSYKLFAAKDGIPFFACPSTMIDGEFIVPKGQKVFVAYRSAVEFFCSDEVSFMPLKEAVELWLASGSVQRESVMSLYDEMPTATVSEAAAVVAERNKASLARRNGALIQGGRDFSRLGDNPNQHSYRGGFGGHHD